MYLHRIIAATLATSVIAQTQDAPEVTSSPSDHVYEAILPENPFFDKGSLDGNIRGTVKAQSAADGKGVSFSVSFRNLPNEGGPFLYHIHDAAVPSDGNCTATLDHFDPFNRGESPPCDANEPHTCQLGDLSGKHGKITQEPFTKEYIDPFVSLATDSVQFFGTKSIVLHFGNKTRITCANFVKAGVEETGN
ncbi:Cu,Zn superoxide dismutase-like protein [Aspergillus avenaceus]|uniref:superoxide dismutase n=1 Tax=Aspergillus avenaceus TaxID=36643 RepID=A0A5N6U2I2_ASPAV|nr:Cu,Zn superoxide dismutase-like protein [Aspergillus avenaceus]